ncbi:MAG: AI-2E family transporter [bacterium]|nr:AI-2E family transporter [bacterium]
MTRRIDISWKTIIFVTAFFILLWIIFKILDIILLFFVAFIFMSALTPIIERLVKWKVPKSLAVIVVVLSIILGIIGALAVGITPLVTQTSNLGSKLSETVALFPQTLRLDQSVISQEVSRLSGQAVSITVDIFRNVIGFVSVLVITIYLLLDREKIEGYATSFFGPRQDRAKKILRMIEDKLGDWLRGQLVLSLAVGVMVYIGLVALGLDYALPLAIIAGFLEVVPVLGPIISAIPAILLALTVSPLLALLVAGVYFVIQELEGHLLVPLIMKRAVGLNPILVILAISVGSRLLGLGGALLAVPIAVVIQLILQESLKIEEELS